MSTRENETNTFSTRIITSKKVSTEIFAGAKSEWAILQMVRKKQIPHLRIGNRIFFEESAIRDWAIAQSEASIKPTENSNGGIRRLK